MSAVSVELVDRGVSAALGALARQVGDVSEAWEQVGDDAVDAAAPYVPVVSGALVDSLTAEAGPDGVDVSSDLVYAGVIDQGWPARNITGVQYMTHAEDVVADSGDELSDLIQRTIDQLGLS